MLVKFDWRVASAVSVFLVCFAVSGVKTFSLLSGTTVSTNIYVIAVLFAGFTYVVFSLATAAIMACLETGSS